MAGANPQRTSWVSDEVKGQLYPAWYRKIEPYIPDRVQVVAANNTLFISTSRGLYALDAASGAQKWTYATQLPLGNSPTINNNIAYVGGFDRKIHAINALTGAGLWTFEAGAGFDTNPLVIEGKVFAGNRDGYFYAVYAEGSQKGQLAWKFRSGGPIHYSAAYDAGVIYFASDDMHAYALNSSTGAQVWKSAKLPGVGFQSWWPVVYQNTIILTGSSAYRNNVPPGDVVNGQQQIEADCLFPNGQTSGALIGSRGSDGWINAAGAEHCIEDYPWRRTYFVLNKTSGVEVTYDFDSDGKADYAPIFWFGARAGNRFPAIVGKDGIVYQSASYTSDQYGFRGHVVGWTIGTAKLSTPSAITLANDEPMAYSAGGSMIYWTHCCDRSSGGVDTSTPNTGSIDSSREWRYYDEGGRMLTNLVPGYNSMYRSMDIDAVYSGINGTYGIHGDQSPPIPYNGKLYMIRSNAIIAFGPSTSAPASLPLAQTQGAASTVSITRDQLKQKLADEVQKVINVGHLRTAYGISGNFDRVGHAECGENLLDYWHDPSDSIYTLLRALPHLPAGMQPGALSYLQSEFTNYSPYNYVHIGWAQGAAREAFDLPPEIQSALSAQPASAWATYDFSGWAWPPHLYYTLWKYAQVFPANARQIFDAAQANAPLESPRLIQN